MKLLEFDSEEGEGRQRALQSRQFSHSKWSPSGGTKTEGVLVEMFLGLYGTSLLCVSESGHLRRQNHRTTVDGTPETWGIKLKIRSPLTLFSTLKPAWATLQYGSRRQCGPAGWWAAVRAGGPARAGESGVGSALLVQGLLRPQRCRPTHETTSSKMYSLTSTLDVLAREPPAQWEGRPGAPYRAGSVCPVLVQL